MFEQFLLYLVAALTITAVVFKKGKLKNLGKKTLSILTFIGVALPWVDTVETAIGFNYEGNPLLLAQYNFSPLLTIIIFVLVHLGVSLFLLFCGKSGQDSENEWARMFLVFLDSMFTIIVVANAINLFLWLTFPFFLLVV